MPLEELELADFDEKGEDAEDPRGCVLRVAEAGAEYQYSLRLVWCMVQLAGVFIG